MFFEITTFRHVLTSFSVSVLFAIILLIFIKNKKLKKIIFWLFVPIYTLQTISIVTTGWDAGYQFLVNLFDYTVIKTAFTVYLKYSLIGIILFILIYFFVYKLSLFFEIKNKYIRLPILCITLVYLICPYSTIFRFFSIFIKYFSNPTYSLTQKELFKEISGKDFVNKEEIKAKINGKPKNLVIIFLESLEQSMLENEYFKELTKNLQEISKEGEFFKNIRQIEGSGWTMAGVHTVLCGDVFAYHSTNVFSRHNKTSNLLCIPDILKTTGYYMINIGGDYEMFAGRRNFMELHGYDKIYSLGNIKEIMNIPDSLTNGWGIKDIDSINFAKGKFIELSKQEKPLHILTKTIDIHPPNGEYDLRCSKITDNNTLNVLKCTDNNLKDFIDFLKQQPNYKDTLVVILPDHLYMAHLNMNNDVSKFLNKIKDRRLYAIILNSGKKAIYNDEILYVDLANIILDRLGIVHNVNFLLDKNNNKNLTIKERVDFIKDNFDKIKYFNNKTVLQE